MSEKQHKASEGAMRAARALIDILAPGDHERNVLMAADLIDRETGLPDLLAACEAVLACPIGHDETGHAVIRVPASSVFDIGAQVHDAISKATRKPAEAHGAD